MSALNEELAHIRKRLAQRFYSPASERDISALLGLLTDNLSKLEAMQPVATSGDVVQPGQPPEHVPPAPDEWNRTELRAEMQRIRDNVERWRRVGASPGYEIWLRFLRDLKGRTIVVTGYFRPSRIIEPTDPAAEKVLADLGAVAADWARRA